MMNKAVPAREAIATEYTWNAPSVFASDEAWESELKAIRDSLSDLDAFKEKLNNSPSTLADFLDVQDSLTSRLGKVMVYAGMSYSVDTGNQHTAGMFGQARGLAAEVIAARSFSEPELLAIGQETLAQWMEDKPRLAIYQHYIDNLFRQQAHVRSAEVEELLGMLSDPFSSARNTAALLTNADFKFAPAVAADGNNVALTQGTVERIKREADRETRRTAWENYADLYLAYKNTLASNLVTSMKQNVFQQRTRRYDSTLDMALFADNIPTAVYDSLIETFKHNLPTWHRYWAVRRKALGVDKLQPYDIWAPLAADQPAPTYEKSVEWICEGLAPLGEEYVAVMRRGCLEDRWVDIYPNAGKRGGAFSSGTRGTYPFIMMSYSDTLSGMSTLAHELGHSMHSYLAWENQPEIYAHYSLFAAEVASNFHQAMVRAHLREKFAGDANFQIALIEEAMGNFHRYFLIMPTLARFELEMHQRIERGQSPAADDMNELMADLFSEAYGDQMHVDRDRVGITWATFGHLYADYYVFQYATGISGAHALANRILSGEAGAAEDYLKFLEAGGSMYPTDALKMAGVDLTTPTAVEETFGVLASMVDTLEELLG